MQMLPVMPVRAANEPVNVALNKPVEVGFGGENGQLLFNSQTSSVTDGRTDPNSYFVAQSTKGAYVTIDLQDEYNLSKIIVYGDYTADYPSYKNTSHAVVVRLSTDPYFSDETTYTVFNTDKDNVWGFGSGTDEERPNTPEGREIILEQPIRARYIRYYQESCTQVTTPGFLKGRLSIYEIEAYEYQEELPATIVSIRPVTVITTVGVAPVLPGEVTAEYDDGSSAMLPVIWDTFDPSEYESEGEFKVEGTVDGTQLKAEVTVIVQSAEIFSFTAGDATFILNSAGVITNILDKNGVDYAEGADVPKASLIKLVMAPTEEEGGDRAGKDGTEIKPVSLRANGNVYTFTFANGIEVDVTKTQKEKYTTLEVTRLDKKGLDVELLMWGPITTNIKENFGETLGVVYNNNFALGMRGLNNKTQLNAPYEYAGHDGRLNVSYPQDRSRFKGRVWSLSYCGASPTTWGSILQAFTYDGTKERVRFVNLVSGEQRVPPLAGDDAEIVGSKVAIYGKNFGDKTAKEAVLDTIGTMELAEGLPHPLIDGEWQKTSPKATRPYFIINDLSVGQADSISKIEKASQYANEANIGYVYKDTFFSSNGSMQFNGGYEAMKAVVDKAAEYGVKVGTHTLSSFVDYGDPLVTTKENKGQFAGAPLAQLTQDAEAGATELYVTADWKNIGMTKQLGDDLFSIFDATPSGDGYRISLSTPLKYSHSAGETVFGLYNNVYGGLIGGVEQTKEFARLFAEAFNKTGLSQISFDGVEAGEYNGYSHYPVSYIQNEFYNQLDPDIKDGIISDSSGGYPNAWHFNTRQNWGEPWGAPMRGGMIDYRYDNQLYFERNFTPKMLGWFIYGSGQPTVDIEWMLAKSAGFDAGYALVTSLAVLEGNGNTHEVLEAVKEWQKAREIGAFTEDQKNRMLDTSKDWHLEKTEEEGVWKLYCINYPVTPVSKYYDGEVASFDYVSPYHDQTLHFQLQAKNGEVRNPRISIGGRTVSFVTTIPKDHYLVYKGGSYAKILDSRWNEKGQVEASFAKEVIVKKGLQKVDFDFDADNTSVQAQIRVITQSYPEDVYVGNPAKGPTEYPDDPPVIGSDNLALGKTVTASADGLFGTVPSNITDGKADPTSAFVAKADGGAYITIDLGRSYSLNKIILYQEYTADYPEYYQIPHKVVVRLSNDPDFEDDSTVTVYNTDAGNSWGFGEGTDPEEVNTPDGKVIEFAPINARYIRYYQNGATQLKDPGALPGRLSLYEIEAYGDFNDNDIKDIYVPEVITYKGIAPVFPSKATVVYGNNTTGQVKVIWDDINEADYQAVGRFEVRGRLAGTNEEAVVTVIVTEEPIAVLKGKDSVNIDEEQGITLTYGLYGINGIKNQSLRVYFDKNILTFNKEGEGINVISENTRLKSFNVNNEAALIDILLESDPAIEDPGAILELTFGVKAQGVGKIEIKQAIIETDQGTVDVLLTGLYITVDSSGNNPAILLTGDGVVEAGDTYTAALSIDMPESVVDAIYAQDITITYDPNVFEFTNIDNVKDGLNVQVDSDTAGIVHILLASLGGQNGISSDTDLLNLVFTAKNVPSIKSGIFVTEAILADGDGYEIEAEVSSIDEVLLVNADINGDGKVSVGDLGIIGRFYGEDVTQAPEAAAADINCDGVVGLEDLVFAARRILGK